MKLGHTVEISLAVTDLPRSAAFYRLLGFEPAGGEDAAPRFHDGMITLALAVETGKSPALTYATTELEPAITALEAAGIEVIDSEGGISFEDPNGLTIRLRAGAGSPAAGRERKSFSKCGEFGELAVPTADLLTSRAFWEQVGFQRIAGGAEPYPWGIMSDGLATVGLHQCGEFASPHLTYFSPDAPARIARLKQEGLTFHDETRDDQGQVNGGTLIAPDGQRIFVFAE